MPDTSLTPYLMKLVSETGILTRGVEHAMGSRMHMPMVIATERDKTDPAIYADIKVGLLATIAGTFIDKHFPTLAEDIGQDRRGEIVFKLGCEIYRLLTDGLSIDVIRHVCEYPDPFGDKIKS